MNSGLRTTRRAFLKRFGGGLLGLYATPAWASGARQVVVRSGASIQEAIDRAPSGGTIRVEPGVYRETLIIEKPLTISSRRGAQNTIIEADPARFDYRDRPREEVIVGAFNVYETDDVTLEGFTVTNALEGIWISASQRVLIKNCVSFGNASSGYYFWACQDGLICRSVAYDNAVGVYEGQSGNVSIEESLFLLNRGGVAPHLGGHHGLELPGIGILCGNRSNGGRIEGCQCLANTDVGIEINIGVRDKLIRRCQLSANRWGLSLGERVRRIEGCNISGNREGGLETSRPTHARHNWWGAPSGPSGAGPGTGDAVTEGVEYEPWLTEPAEIPPLEI